MIYVTKVITIIYNLNWQETRIKRQIKLQIIRIKFHNFIGFGILKKYCGPLRHSTIDISLENFWDFERIFWMVVSKVIAQTEKCSKLALKSPILP